MLSELEFLGFKGLSGLSLVGLKRLTLIGGKNNTGKTSLLEGLFLSMDWGNPQAFLRHLNMRGLNVISVEGDSMWSPAFSDFSTEAKLQIKSRDLGGVRRAYTAQVFKEPAIAHPKASLKDAANIPSSMSQPRLRISATKGSKPVFEATASVTLGEGPGPRFNYHVSTQVEAAPRAHFLLGRERPNLAESVNFLGELDREKRLGEVVDVLRVFEPNLVGLSVIPIANIPIIHADVSGVDKKIPLNLMGDGITKFLDMLLRLTQIKGGYLLLDEIENGFHHSVLPKIWEALFLGCRRYQCQLLATTHSYECLTAFAKCSEDQASEDFSYIRLDRLDGKVTPTSYDSQALRDATSGGWEVR